MLRSSFRCFFQRTATLLVPPTTSGPVPRGLRLHGTVTAFKHRRGYGFVLAEGVARASALGPQNGSPEATSSEPTTTTKASVGGVDEESHTQSDKDWIGEYFFTRSALGGGFYVTEGERISFGIRPLTPEQLEARRLNASRRGVVAEPDTGSLASALHVASRILLYDLKTGTETPVTPPTLCGKVISWDEATSAGVISELDTRGYYHEDAPRFAFTREDTDLAEGVKLNTGRFVRFAPAAESSQSSESSDALPTDADVAAPAKGLPRAERIIIDVGNERRHAVLGTPISAGTAATRFRGTVREIIDGKYGFILDDLTGDSIFFHLHNSVGGGHLSAGDRVSYLLREISMGKHAGKKSCLKVRLEEDDSDAELDSAGGGSASLHSSAGSGLGLSKRTSSPHRTSRQRAPVEDDDDFHLLD